MLETILQNALKWVSHRLINGHRSHPAHFQSAGDPRTLNANQSWLMFCAGLIVRAAACRL